MSEFEKKDRVYVIAKAKWKTEKVYHSGTKEEKDEDPFYVADDRSFHSPYTIVEVYESKEDAKKILSLHYPKEFISKSIQTIKSGFSSSWREINEYIEYTVYAVDCQLKYDKVKNEVYTYIDNKRFAVMQEYSNCDTSLDYLS